jgi:hypothetical protein
VFDDSDFRVPSTAPSFDETSGICAIFIAVADTRSLAGVRNHCEGSVVLPWLFWLPSRATPVDVSSLWPDVALRRIYLAVATLYLIICHSGVWDNRTILAWKGDTSRKKIIYNGLFMAEVVERRQVQLEFFYRLWFSFRSVNLSCWRVIIKAKLIHGYFWGTIRRFETALPYPIGPIQGISYRQGCYQPVASPILIGCPKNAIILLPLVSAV